MSTQTWRVEVRFDVTGTKAEAEAEGHRVAGLAGEGGEITAIFDEDWNET